MMNGSAAALGSSGGNRNGKRLSGGGNTVPNTSSSHAATPSASNTNAATTPTRAASNSKGHVVTSTARSSAVASSTEKLVVDLPKALLADFSTPASSNGTRSLPHTPHATPLFNDSASTPMSSSGAQGVTGSESDMIKVAVRVRPLLGDELNERDSMGWGWNQSQVYATTSIAKRGLLIASPDTASVVNNNTVQYTFDNVFGPESTNPQIFERIVKDIVANSMTGYHGSIFSYGQTSSGKTFTMNGVAGQPGIIAQAVKHCFESVQQFLDREFLIRVSYLEVYNEQIKDLLNHEQLSSSIKIQHDPKLGTVLSGVREQVVGNAQQVMTLIKLGELHRHIGVTDMNEKSSRAHTLFKIIIESKDRNSTKANAPVRVSTLNLVDLAGSESAKMTNSKGDRAREAKHINQSLLTLSLIIQRLSEDHQQHASGKKATAQHLPYRDSKLTRLLESALDGNARIAIICTISPTIKCMEETNNTLKFGTRAKSIKINAKINENMDDKALLRVYREEIEQLRLKLRMMEEKQSDQVAHSIISPSAKSPDTGKQQNRQSPKLSTLKKIRSKDDNSAEDGSLLEDEDEEELPSEEQQQMLRMIAEMERLILKGEPKLDLQPMLTKKKSFASTNPMKSPPSSGGTATLPATHSFNFGSVANSPRKMQRALSMPMDNKALSPSTSPSKPNTRKSTGSGKFSAELLVGEGVGIGRSVGDESHDDHDVVKVGSDAWDDIVGSVIIPDNNLGYDDEDSHTSANKRETGSSKKERPADLVLDSDLSARTSLSGESSTRNGMPSSTPTSQKKKTTFSFIEPSKPPLSPNPTHAMHNAVAFSVPEESSSRSASPLTSLENTKRLLQKAQSVKIDTLFSLYNQLEGSAGRLGIVPSSSEDATHSEIHERVRALSIEELISPIVKPNILSSTPMRTKHRILSRSNSMSAMPSHALLAQHGMMPLDTRVADGIGSANVDPDIHMLRSGSLEHSASKSQDESAGNVEDIYYNSALSASGPILSTPSELIIMEEEDDGVMKGVSTMLNMLKDYIAKPKQANKRHSKGHGGSEQQESSSSKSLPDTTALSTSDITIAIPSTAVPHIPLNGHSHNHSAIKSDDMVPRADYERLKLEMKLREADNNFLQEELENKDKMLHLLTAGLKEVEVAQKQWLSTNQELSYELDRALQVNQLLCTEIRRLKGLLDEERITKSSSLAEETQTSQPPATPTTATIDAADANGDGWQTLPL